jgi:threonine aldolase
LSEDHANARRLAAAFDGLTELSVESPQSNMVFVDAPPQRLQTLVRQLAEHGVLATGLYRLRLVTHLDVGAKDVDRAAQCIRDALRRH